MKTTLATIALALALGACTTFEGTIKSAPDVERTVNMDIDKVRDCLVQETPTGFDVVSYQGGYRIWSDGGTATSVNNVAILEPTTEGVHVRIWNHAGWNPFPRSLDKCAP